MKIFLLSFLLSTTVYATEVPLNFTYQGRLVKSNGVDYLESPSVTFKLQIRSPDGLCLLFEETHWRDMSGTDGIFTLIVGEGSNTGATNLDLVQVFNNNTAKNGHNCSYTPITGDTRRLRFSYDDGQEVVSLPVDQTLHSVPYALNSMTLQGLAKDKFIQTSPVITQNSLESLMAVSANLLTLQSGNSSHYIKSADLPLAGGVLNMSGGSIKVADSPSAGDQAVNKNYSDSKMGGKALDLTGLTNGQILTWNSVQNKWVASSPLQGTMTAIIAGAGLTGGTITNSGTISLAAAGTAGTYTKVTTDVYGRVTSGGPLTESDLPSISGAGKISGDSINSGTLSGTVAINTSGALTTTGNMQALNVSATTGSLQSLRLFNTGNTFKINLTAPASLAADYSLELPSVAGTANQFLVSNGSGKLIWSTPNNVTLSDLKNNTGGSLFLSPNCSSTETLSWNSGSDTFSCISIQTGSTSQKGLLQVGTGLSVSSGTVSLASSGVTAGTYTSLTVDAYGRVTGGTNPASATTLSGYGITDAIKNVSGVPSLQSGTDAGKPAAGQAGRLYVATDVLRIYRDNGTNWVVISTPNEGTVTGVTAGNGLTGGTVNVSGTIAVDAGTAANQVVQLDSSARLPAVDGSQLRNLPTTAGNMRILTADTTWTPPTGITKVYVQVWGAGGGGAGGNTGVLSAVGGCGGGGGSYAMEVITLSSSDPVQITVGAGGLKGAINANGSAGGTSSFGTYISAGGGAGGTMGCSFPIIGGITSAVAGTNGGHAVPLIGSNGGAGGTAAGGGAFGALGSTAGGSNPAAGSSPGGGGGGGFGSIGVGSTGSNGGAGRVIIMW